MNIEETKIKPDGYAEQSPKYLKNIIAKMRELPEHDRAVWIEGIFKEFGIENSLQTKDSLKPEIEQFVAEWYEENKEGLWETVIDLIRVDERLMYKHANPPKAPSKEDKRFLEWLFREDDAFEILSDMHKFGYEVEREKLYTVEIPNPNDPIEYHSKLAKNHKGEIVIEVQDWMNRTEYYQLTEQEIRKDFDWAWQWAEEVTE